MGSSPGELGKWRHGCPSTAKGLQPYGRGVVACVRQKRHLPAAFMLSPATSAIPASKAELACCCSLLKVGKSQSGWHIMIVMIQQLHRVKSGRSVLTTLGLRGLCSWHHSQFITPRNEMLHQQDNSWREEHTRVPVHWNGNWSHRQQLNKPGNHFILGKHCNFEYQHEQLLTSSAVHCLWPEYRV